MSRRGMLSGSPWHVEYLRKAEDEPKRDRRKCKYYVDDDFQQCRILYKKCYGSRYCEHYSVSEIYKRTKKVLNQIEPLQKVYEISYGKEISKHLFIGNSIEHQYYGLGKIIHLEGNSITLLFKLFNERTLDLETCIRNNFFSFEE
ncbi:hypothetical protein HT668_05405 [Ursidibacter maritimus]|uniref:hypothetical protein n=1 Tax=Ursidibacter maritimus TaxID=1331689 RepID=UPI001C445A19|nr:hypothetical protein [Ursidibacter maritimus]MBV6544661.1 hypothetical protein [Ursidibacter maritimus]